MRTKAGRLTDRIQDIREAINNAKSDVGTLSQDEFLRDGKTQRATIECIIVMGEAANSIMRLAPHLEQQFPVAWQHLKDVYDMRIILTHEYFRVDLAIVWTTLQTDIPALASALDTIAAS
jgi:uncharacterized protein with HEPN domain